MVIGNNVSQQTILTLHTRNQDRVTYLYWLEKDNSLETAHESDAEQLDTFPQGL